MVLIALPDMSRLRIKASQWQCAYKRKLMNGLLQMTNSGKNDTLEHQAVNQHLQV